MLMATQSAERHRLELLTLALSMMARGQSPLPIRLGTLVREILNEATVLSTSPDTLRTRPKVESIELALRLANDQRLREDIQKARDLESVPPELAARLLQDLKNPDASTYQSYSPS